MLFEYAFNEVNLNRLNAWVAIENTRLISFTEKIGFISETILEQQWYYGGKYVDVKIFRLLKNEWIKKKE